MKIDADRASLAAALSWTALAVQKRMQIPVLSGIRLTATPAGELVASAFDGDTAHIVALPVDCHGEGEALVSGRFLAALMENLRGDRVTLEVEDNQLHIRAGRAAYRAQVMQLDTYPAMPDVGTTVGTIDADELNRIIRVTGGPVGDDPDRPATAGLHLETDEADVLWAVGSDDQARSLHVCTGEWKEELVAGERLDVTLPVARLAAAARGLTGIVEIGIDDGIVGFRDDTHTVLLRPYASAYFGGRWRALLDREAVAVATVKRAELADALRRASAFGEKVIGLVVEPDSLTIQSGAEVGAGEDVIDAEVPGDYDFEVASFGVNVGLFGLALAATDAEEITLGLPETGVIKGKPIDVRPVGRDDVRCLVMPREWAR